jgi:hypothetical protein
MYKVDCEINKWVADWMKTNFDWITDATADCIEDYSVGDIVFSACTKSGDVIVKPQEVKTYKGGWQFKYNGEWSDYFLADNPKGVTKKMMFGNTPPNKMSIMDVPYHWDPDSFTPEYAEMPEEWKGKHIYMLNAEDKYHRVHNSKFYKMINAHACLCYVAPDGLIFFNPTKLKDAVLGYAWYQVKSHTEEFGEKRQPVWELKVILDLDKGSYHPATPPKELFTNNRF